MTVYYYGQDLYHHGIRGQKWGVRRYQNADGTLTDAGKKRYDRDVRENKARKKDKRIDTSEPDPNRWVKEDRQRAKDVVDTSNKLVGDLQKVEQNSRPQPIKKKMDLSSMSDKELRDQINRKLLEQQYEKLYAEETAPAVSKGRVYVQDTLETAGAVLGVASSALGIALAIGELRGK